jgi:hypothetical protein
MQLTMRPNTFWLEKLVTRARFPAAFFGGIYAFSMFIFPWIDGGLDWRHVQDVWDRWQGVNVGILAFAASFIAFEITRYNERRQSRREFLAARAFLPQALSGLSGYLQQCADVHMALWNNGPVASLPTAPSDYQDVFRDCIRHADSDMGKQLASIQVWLQIHTARLNSVVANPRVTTRGRQHAALEGLLLVGELQAKVNKLFEFARGMGDLDTSPLGWDDYRTAYINLGLTYETLVIGPFSLEQMTRNRLDRGASDGAWWSRVT